MNYLIKLNNNKDYFTKKIIRNIINNSFIILIKQLIIMSLNKNLKELDLAMMVREKLQ